MSAPVILGPCTGAVAEGDFYVTTRYVTWRGLRLATFYGPSATADATAYRDAFNAALRAEVAEASRRTLRANGVAL